MKLLEAKFIEKKAYLDYIKEWRDAGEPIIPMASDCKVSSFETWLEETEQIKHKITCPEGWVTAQTHFVIDDQGKLCGAINIRHELNDFLLKTGGHIGYGVRPSERGKGHARWMLLKALDICKDLSITYVLITCDQSNIASINTILSVGGEFKNEVVEEGTGKIKRRYWVKL